MTPISQSRGFLWRCRSPSFFDFRCIRAAISPIPRNLTQFPRLMLFRLFYCDYRFLPYERVTA